MGWHVEVVQEAQQALPTYWHKCAFGSLLYAALHDGLDVTRGGLGSDGETKMEKKMKWYVSLHTSEMLHTVCYEVTEQRDNKIWQSKQLKS